MNTIIIPQSISKKGDLVVLSRKDYEDLFRSSSISKKDWVYEKDVSKYIQNRINKAETEFKKGKAIKWQAK